MKILKCIIVAVVIVLAVIADISFVSDCLSLSDTCLLWVNGRVQGWAEIVIFLLCMDAFIAIPAYMMWDSIE